MKHCLFVLLFIARIAIPVGIKVVYENVEKIETSEFYYHLYLTDGREVYAPVMFTVIEEIKNAK